MATTIQISDETKRLLDIKKKNEHKSYDEVVQSLLRKESKIREKYGKYKLNGWNKKEDRLDIDESNRN